MPGPAVIFIRFCGTLDVLLTIILEWMMMILLEKIPVISFENVKILVVGIFFAAEWHANNIGWFLLVDSSKERAPAHEGPKERPRLKLQPRTKPIEEAGQVNTGSSSIFGGAKPVDTAAREREIEERLISKKHHPDRFLLH